MGYKAYLKLVALFLAVIVINLPIVHATALELVQYSGTDNIDGFRKYDDTITLSANVQIDDDSDIGPSQVRLQSLSDGIPSGIEAYFNSCSPESGFWKCAYSAEHTAKTKDKYTYRVDIYDDAGNSISQETGFNYYTDFSLVVDKVRPSIVLFTAEPKLTNTGDITITYSAMDTAYPGSAECVGIQAIMFRENDLGGAVLLSDTPADPTTCAITKVMPHHIDSSKKICIQAVDRFGYESTELMCQDIEVDMETPLFMSAELLDYGGNEILYARAKPIDNLNLIVRIAGTDIDKNSVRADLEDINAGLGSSVPPDDCETGNGVTECTWPGLTLYIENEKTPSPIISGQDMAGNSFNFPAPTSPVKFDNQGPRFEGFSILTMDGGPSRIGDKWFMGHESIVAADIEDEIIETGDSPEVYADMSGLSPGWGKVRADYCEGSSPNYKCYWNITLAEDAWDMADAEIKGNPDTTDALGNKAKGAAKEMIKVNVDVTRPAIRKPSGAGAKISFNHYIDDPLSMSIAPGSGMGVEERAVLPNILVKGDIITITAVIREKIYLDSAAANFSRIIPGLEKSIGDCERMPVDQVVTPAAAVPAGGTAAEGGPSPLPWDVIPEPEEGAEEEPEEYIEPEMSDYWFCTWDLNRQVEMPLPGKVDVGFTFTDGVGNSVSTSRWATVYGLVEDQDPDYWYNEGAECTPVVDRGAAEKRTFTVWCTAKLIPFYPGEQQTLTIKNLECKSRDPEVEYAKYIQKKQRILNTVPGSTQPIFQIKLRTAEFDINTLELECPLDITSMISTGTETYITPYTETESINLTIRFYNQPLGGLGENIEQDIEDAYEFATAGYFEITSTINEIMKYAEMICGLIKTWYRIKQLWDTVVLIWGLQAEAAEKVPFTAAAGKAMRASVAQMCSEGEAEQKIMEESVWGKDKALDKFCAWVNCKHAPLPEKDKKQLSGLESFGYYTGGSGGFGTEMDNWLEGTVKKGFTPQQYANVKRNYILSLVFFCLPGILYNLDKYRQIECKYADCMMQSASTPIPKSFCEKSKAWDTCMFFIGPIFQAFPWTAFIEEFYDKIVTAISNPFSIILSLLGIACSQFCSTKTPILSWWGCRMPAFLDQLMITFNNVRNILREDYWQVSNDYCEAMEETRKSYEENIEE